MPRSKLVPIIVLGVVGSGFPAILFAAAERHLDSGIAGVLNSLVPIFTLILGIAFFQQKLVKIQLVGIALGLSGAVLLVFRDFNLHAVEHFQSVLYILIAVLMYATSTNIMKRYLNDANTLAVSAVAMFFVSIPALIYLLVFSRETLANFSTNSYIPFFSVVALGVFSTGLALVFFQRLVQLTDPVFSSFVTYLVPIIALVWGNIFGEKLIWIDYLACGVILFGLLVMNKKRLESLYKKLKSNGQ